MTIPIRHLPVVQNWDCHSCTNCCREFMVYLTEAERRRIEEQDWDDVEDLSRMRLIVRQGWWSPRYRLNHRHDDRCVFLNDEGRCRIHERYGAEAKPLACRVYPFVLVPAGKHWRVGLRYACPSVADNKGRPISEHMEDLESYAATLEKQEDLEAGLPPPPPPLQGRQRVGWPDMYRFTAALLKVFGSSSDAVEHRWRKCLTLVNLCRQAKFDVVQGDRLSEFLNLVLGGPEVEVPTAAKVPAPGWIGRVLFRQIAAVYARKDSGPERGTSAQGRLALVAAAWRFAMGKGRIPRLHAALPDTTFERLELPAGPLPEAAEKALERYYLVKIESLQFCGSSNFGLSFWDGVESLATTYPAILWLSRAFADLPREAAISRATQIVDNNFGFSPLLGGRRQRTWLRILAQRGELEKLIAWYSL